MQYTTPPTLEDMAILAERALASIPERFTRDASELELMLEDIADDETLDAMGIESGYDLTGLYRAEPPAEPGAAPDPDREPDMVLLYREPILLEWIESGEDLYRLIRTVLIHEVAHHYNLSEDDVATLEAAA